VKSPLSQKLACGFGYLLVGTALHPVINRDHAINDCVLKLTSITAVHSSQVFQSLAVALIHQCEPVNPGRATDLRHCFRAEEGDDPRIPQGAEGRGSLGDCGNDLSTLEALPLAVFKATHPVVLSVVRPRSCQ